MSTSILKDNPKKRGRPATGKDPMLGFRSPSDLTMRIDKFAKEQKIARAEAIRRLVERSLDPPTYFHAIVRKDSDSAYGIEFPDLPGCFSAADDETDIIPNAIEALALHFDNVPMPPETLDAIHHANPPVPPPGARVIKVPCLR